MLLTSQQLKYGKLFISLLQQPASAVLTQEREISTCPQHIPALAPSSTHLLSELRSNSPSAAARIPTATQQGSFLNALNVKSRRQVTAEQLHCPDQMWNRTRHSRNFKCLLNYLTQKLQKVTHHSEVKGEGGRWNGSRANSSAPRCDAVPRRKSTVTALHVGFNLTSIKSSPLASTCATWWKLFYICKTNCNLSVLRNCSITLRSTTVRWLNLLGIYDTGLF